MRANSDRTSKARVHQNLIKLRMSRLKKSTEAPNFPEKEVGVKLLLSREKVGQLISERKLRVDEIQFPDSFSKKLVKQMLLDNLR